MSWGSNEWGQLGDGKTKAEQPSSDVPVQVSDVTGTTAIAAGTYHSLALLDNGQVLAWDLTAPVSSATAIPPARPCGSKVQVCRPLRCR